MKVREDRGDASPGVTLSVGQLRAPGSPVEVRQQELIHRVIHRVGFEQDVPNLDEHLFRS